MRDAFEDAWPGGMSEAEFMALAEAIGKGGVPKLVGVVLDGNPASEAAQEAVMDAIAKQRK